MRKIAAKKPAPPRKAGAKQRALGKRAATLEAAKAGKLPAPPDFSAATHKRWRPMLHEVVALAKAGGLEALKGYEIKAYSTSPRAIARYRDLAVLALSARNGTR